MTRGILAYGSYVPYFRLSREALGAALGTPSGSGTRAVAAFDEDSTSMAVEAGRSALAAFRSISLPPRVHFATTTPAYADKTNATAIHAALGLPREGFAVDMVGAVRSGLAAIRAGLEAADTTLAVLADVRTGLPGSADERDGGDGAVAFAVGDGAQAPVIAEVVAWSSATAEFADRWRVPGAQASRTWEERFGESAYVPLADEALAEAVKTAGVLTGEIDRVVVTGTHARAVRTFSRQAGFSREQMVDDLGSVVGNTGTAHPGLLLASVLDAARPEQVIALCVLADGADVLILRTTDAIAGYRRAQTVASLVAGARGDVSYTDFLTWRGFIRREPPRRPDPAAPAAPPSFRAADWKYGFTGSTCEACGGVHVPPQRVCAHCGAIDQMRATRLAGARGRITTVTVDRLAYSLNPPVVVAIVDLEGGGRFQCEMTDVDPTTAAIGDDVELTFRRLYDADGVQNYFWKARPIREGSA